MSKAGEEGKEMPEPTSSVLALAGNAAAEVVTPKVRELLLGPLAKAYGDHWGAEAEERLQRRREERRAKNVYGHVQAVALLSPKRSFEDVSDDPNFDEWLRGASSVDPEVDRDLADFWRAALVAIAEGDMDRLRLLRIVRSLGPDDAVYLATADVTHSRLHPAGPFSEDSDYIKRLEKAGVLENPWRSLRERPTVLFSAIAMPLMMYLTMSLMAVPDSFIIGSSVPNREIFQTLALPAAIFTFIFSTFYVVQRLSFSARRLTSDGKKLLALLDRVRNRYSSSRSPDETA